MRNSKNVVYSAMFLAIGMVLPLFTAQIKEIGDTLLPMHFPILLCGLVCGPWYGLGAGLMLPFFRSLNFRNFRFGCQTDMKAVVIFFLCHFFILSISYRNLPSEWS